ncbi:MAG: 16S rRNA (uracil(1498)-N(3))-methyltransferase [Pseudomonadales bacterium]
MNLIIVFEQDFIADNIVTLSDQRFEHIRTIYRASIGDSLRVGKLNGLMGMGTIQTMTDSHVELAVQLDQQAPNKLPLTVILALPRPKMIRRIFRTIAELGINELIIINSYKVEKSFWHSPALDEEKVKHYLIAGLQQAKDTVLPKVSFKRLFKPFVEDELATLVSGSKGLVAHPGIGTTCPHHIDQAVTLAIGPEGGFTDYEVNKFIAAGFDGIHLGERILRVENALTALTSKLYQ